MEEAECNQGGESIFFTVLGYSLLSFKFIPYIEKQHSYWLFIAISSCCFVALRPKSTAMVMLGRSIPFTTLFLGQA